MLISYFWGWAASVRFVRQKSGQRWEEAANRRITRIGMHTGLDKHHQDDSLAGCDGWDVFDSVFINICLIFVPGLTSLLSISGTASPLFDRLLSLSPSLYLIVYFRFHFLLFIITFTFIWLKSILRTAFPLFDDLLSLSLSSYLIIYFLFHVHSKYLWQFFLNWIIYFPFQIISLSTFTFLITVSDCLLSLFLSHSHLYNI